VLAITLLLVLAAEFVNGWTDAPNAIATVVSTRVLSPFQAVTMAAVLNILGALVTGTAVAVTIGKGIIQPEAIGITHGSCWHAGHSYLEHAGVAVGTTYQ